MKERLTRRVETVELETFGSDSGDFIQIIPSGFVGIKLVVYEDVAYQLHVAYLTDETYDKLMKHTINSIKV